MNRKELHKMFPYLSKDTLNYYVNHNEYKTENGFIRFLEKIHNGYKVRAEKKDIKHLKICIEWKRSRTWGNNPHASYWVEFADGTRDFGSGYTASGCGYDKASTVVAEIFNEIACGMLYRRRNTKKSCPYGVCVS